MKVKFVFDDWTKEGESIHQTEEGIKLSLGNFHSGTVFNAEIDLDNGDSIELKKALKSGCTPVFYVVEDK